MNNILSKPLKLPFMQGGIITREVRTALPAVVALALFQFVIPIVYLLVYPNRIGFGGDETGYYWSIFTGLTALLLGVLCGAEEEERGTIYFALRLPVSKMRLLGEKILGSMISLAFWVALAYLFDFAAKMIIPSSIMNIEKITPCKPLYLPLTRGVLMYSCGLLAGVLVKQVLLAVLLGGFIYAALNNVPYFLFGVGTIKEQLQMTATYTPALNWCCTIAVLIITYIRYRAKEGR